MVVNSIGNEGNKVWKYLIAPSDGDSVLSIGAVNANRTISDFSSFGFEWDARVKPNIVAQGGNTVLADESLDGIKIGNGTSYSAPIISGMMACLWQSIPNANNMDIIHAVEQSASQFSNPDNHYGYGIPDFTSAQLILGIYDKPNVYNSFDIIPNPVSNIALIQWNQSLNSFERLELFDLQGRVLIREELKVSQGLYNLSLQGYKKGIYILRLGNQSHILSKKIIKID